LSLKPLIAVTFAEATSWVGLLIAMMFKYGFDMEEGVSIMGRIHGFLFVAFFLVLFFTHVNRKWTVKKTGIAFLESIPPFLGFVLGKQLLDEDRSQPSAASPVTQA
jgi:integral membrane protein